FGLFKLVAHGGIVAGGKVDTEFGSFDDAAQLGEFVDHGRAEGAAGAGHEKTAALDLAGGADKQVEHIGEGRKEIVRIDVVHGVVVIIHPEQALLAADAVHRHVVIVQAFLAQRHHQHHGADNRDGGNWRPG